MRWAINSRNETLMTLIKKKGSAGVCNMRICGRHFTDDMFINSSRLELRLYTHTYIYIYINYSYL